MTVHHAARDRQVKAWREMGLSQSAIARKLKITRQRVQQIEQRLGLPKRNRGNLPVLNVVCRQCSDYFKSKNGKRKFCSRKCAGLAKRVNRSPAEQERYTQMKREKMKAYAKWYYHNVFKKRSDWKEVVKIRNRRWLTHQRH